MARPTVHCSRCSTALVAEQGHEEIVWAVEVCGRRLFSASADKTIRVWDIGSRRCEQVMEDHTRPVLSLSVANGKLFSGSYDYTIKVGWYFWINDYLTSTQCGRAFICNLASE